MLESQSEMEIKYTVEMDGGRTWVREGVVLRTGGIKCGEDRERELRERTEITKGASLGQARNLGQLKLSGIYEVTPDETLSIREYGT